MKFLHSITAAFLAFVVLIASIGLTVNFHYCGEKIRSVAFYVKADPCQNEQSCRDKHSEKKQGCCAERTVIVKGKDLGVSSVVFSQSAPSFKLMSIVLPVMIFQAIRPAAFAISHYTHYKPPLLHRQSQIFLQSFLI